MEGRAMIGYCEACRRESPTEPDEYGVECCTDCGADILIEMHVKPLLDELDPDEWYGEDED